MFWRLIDPSSPGNHRMIEVTETYMRMAGWRAAPWLLVDQMRRQQFLYGPFIPGTQLRLLGDNAVVSDHGLSKLGPEYGYSIVCWALPNFPICLFGCNRRLDDRNIVRMAPHGDRLRFVARCICGRELIMHEPYPRIPLWQREPELPLPRRFHRPNHGGDPWPRTTTYPMQCSRRKPTRDSSVSKSKNWWIS